MLARGIPVYTVLVILPIPGDKEDILEGMLLLDIIYIILSGMGH